MGHVDICSYGGSEAIVEYCWVLAATLVWIGVSYIWYFGNQEIIYKDRVSILLAIFWYG